MSTSGSLDARSTRQPDPEHDEPADDSAIVLGEPQPHEFASVTPEQQRARGQADSSAAPSQSTRGPRRAATRGHDAAPTPNAAGSAMSPIQNSQATPSVVDDHARDQQPDAAADAERRAQPPIALATRSGGNVSRMIPNASGKMPPPTPWIDAPGDEQPIDGASAHIDAPTPKTEQHDGSTRALPKRSPSLPTIGVATDAASR